MNELNTIGLHFRLKFSDTPIFDNSNPSINVNLAEGGVPLTRRFKEKMELSKPSQKKVPVPFARYAVFEALLLAAEENIEIASITKVRQLHKLSRFACFLSPRYRSLTEKYLRTAKKTRCACSSNTSDIRTATSDESYQTQNR